MMLEQLREEVWKANMLLPKAGLVKMTSGNVSGLDPDSGLVVIKPSGYSYDELTSADLVVVDIDGNVIEGRLKPSVDTETHLSIYKQRPDVFGICHTHSPYASSFAALGKGIPACLTTTAMLGGDIPLGCYVPIGGEAIGREVVRSIGRARAILMQNHGVFTIGNSARQAAKFAVEVEDIAKITHLAMLLGEPIRLTEQQLAETGDLYQNLYGQG